MVWEGCDACLGGYVCICVAISRVCIVYASCLRPAGLQHVQLSFRLSTIFSHTGTHTYAHSEPLAHPTPNYCCYHDRQALRKAHTDSVAAREAAVALDRQLKHLRRQYDLDKTRLETEVNMAMARLGAVCMSV